MVKRITGIGLATFILLHVAWSKEPESLRFEFKVFGIGEDSFEGLFYFSGTEYVPLQFHKTYRSVETYTYEGPRQFSVFVRNPAFDPAQPESKAFRPIANLNVQSRASPLLLVFAAARGNRDTVESQRTFTLFEVNDSPEHFRRHSIIVLNATGARLFGKVSDEPITLPLGVSRPITYTRDRESGRTRIAFALETQSGVKLVMSNDLRLADNRRVLLILQRPHRADSLRIRVRMLSESIFPTPEEKG